MAIHERRIKFAFPMRVTSLNAATRLDFSAITVYCPMTVSRLWKSCIVEVTARQDDAAAASLTARTIGISFAGGAFNNQTVTETIANTGEHTSWKFRRDVTNRFNLSYGSGNSQTVAVGVQFDGVKTINIAVELILTFEAEDQSTRIRTLEIPIESTTGGLTTSLAEIGTDQIPQLTGGAGIISEATVTIRDWYLRIEGNEADDTNVTDYGLGLQIDSDTEFTTGNIMQDLASSCSFTYIYSRTSSVPTTTTTHKLKARGIGVTGRWQFSAVLVVTYQYAHDTATAVTNSIQAAMLPVGARILNAPGVTVGDPDRYQCIIDVQEPGVVTLGQSGIVVELGLSQRTATHTMSLKCGTQSFRAYTIPVPGSAGNTCGTTKVCQRIDGGSAAASGGLPAFTLQRGRNVIQLDWAHSENDASGICPVLYLNYRSGIFTSDDVDDGDGCHNQMSEFLIQDNNYTPANGINVAAVAPVFPEEFYYLNQVAYRSTVMRVSEHIQGFWTAEVLSGENEGEGWVPIIGGGFLTRPELGYGVLISDASSLFKRWTGDTLGRMDIEEPRVYRLADTFLPRASLSMVILKHSIISQKTWIPLHWHGGDGSGIPVSMHDADTHEILMAGSTSGGGVWVANWFDDTRQVYAAARQEANFRGRSNDI
jgi:hypothetical protein